MIPQTPHLRQVDATAKRSWQQELADVIRDPEELLALLQLNTADLPKTLSAIEDFPLRVPRPYLQRIEPGNWHDPLLLQILPQGQELEPQPGYSLDPLAEKASNPIPGLIHKYDGRVLLIISSGCAINCRYCFRRHFPYQDNNPARSQWQQALDYIAARPDIHEVIFSGGDPLVASDAYLSKLVLQLAEIPHLQTLRVHSRLPVVIPQRITDSCRQWMTGSRLNPVLVIHSNHGNEFDDEVKNAIGQLKAAGVSLLNQSVLLKGVNDDQQPLAQLSHTLFQNGVLPYYLHMLDPVKGAAHFHVSELRARQLISELLTTLPGYLVPRLVRESPGALSKLPL